MPLFADVQDHDDGLVRKALQTIIAVAPFTADPIDSILDSDDGTLKALPSEYEMLGRLTEDGATWPRETEMSEIFGMGSVNPARSDIRRATKRVTFTLLEARRKGMELAQGTDLSEIQATEVGTDPDLGSEVTWDEPDLPTYPYLRLIAIAQDLTGSGEIYIGRELLRCKVTEVGEETWSDQDQAMTTNLTLTAYNDNEAGTPMRHFRGGPGYAEIVEDEGFQPAA